MEAKSQLKQVVALQQEPVARFFPNPATTQITFDFQKSYNKSYTIQVFSFIGKKMIDQPVTEKVVIALNDFYRGIYIYQIRDKMGKVIDAGKFQVAK